MISIRHDLAQVIASNKTSNIKNLAQEIAAYLLETKQTSELESLMRDVRAHLEEDGKIDATVTSAHELSDALIEEVKALIRQYKPHVKSVKIQAEQDADVVGGLKVRLANEQLDLTIRAQLDTFKRLTSKGTN